METPQPPWAPVAVLGHSHSEAVFPYVQLGLCLLCNLHLNRKGRIFNDISILLIFLHLKPYTLSS